MTDLEEKKADYQRTREAASLCENDLRVFVLSLMSSNRELRKVQTAILDYHVLCLFYAGQKAGIALLAMELARLHEKRAESSKGQQN